MIFFFFSLAVKSTFLATFSRTPKWIYEIFEKLLILNSELITLVSYYLLIFGNTGFGEFSCFYLFLEPPLALGRNSRNEQVFFFFFFLRFETTCSISWTACLLHFFYCTFQREKSWYLKP